MSGYCYNLPSRDMPLVVSFGGGSDSTAMLIEFRNRGVKPDRIQFADTGNRDAQDPGERPETYEHVDRMSELCLQWFGVPVVWVRNDGMYGTLYNNCVSKRMLPSLAYGFKSCSDKYKHRPMEKDLNQWQPAVDWWASGSGWDGEHSHPPKVMKAIGYNASEPHRALNITEDKKYRYWYPLVQWGINAEEVVRICKTGIGYVPSKSSCFFCPAAKKAEVLSLKNQHPLLYEKALLMERNAELKTVKGLGRHWSWESLGRADDAQFKMFPESVEMPCMCFDGDHYEDGE